MTSYVAIDAGS